MLIPTWCGIVNLTFYYSDSDSGCNKQCCQETKQIEFKREKVKEFIIIILMILHTKTNFI